MTVPYRFLHTRDLLCCLLFLCRLAQYDWNNSTIFDTHFFFMLTRPKKKKNPKVPLRGIKWLPIQVEPRRRKPIFRVHKTYITFILKNIYIYVKFLNKIRILLILFKLITWNNKTFFLHRVFYILQWTTSRPILDNLIALSANLPRYLPVVHRLPNT